MSAPGYRALGLALSLFLASGARAQTAYEQLQMLSDALNLVRANYVDSVAYTQLARAAINGILRSLDPHSYYMSTADFERLGALESGKLAGAGVSLTEADGRILVLSVLPRGPAERAGIQAGDRLLAVNDTPTAGSRAVEAELRLTDRNDSGSRSRSSAAHHSAPTPFASCCEPRRSATNRSWMYTCCRAEPDTCA